jgi:hypothetical protein
MKKRKNFKKGPSFFLGIKKTPTPPIIVKHFIFYESKIRKNKIEEKINGRNEYALILILIL